MHEPDADGASVASGRGSWLGLLDASCRLLARMLVLMCPPSPKPRAGPNAPAGHPSLSPTQEDDWLELIGAWDAGCCLGWASLRGEHGADRTEIGRLVYEYKYRQRYELADELAERLAGAVDGHSDLAAIELVVAVPSRLPRNHDPVPELVRRLASRLGLKSEVHAIVRSRRGPAQKEVQGLMGKRRNVEGAFDLRRPTAILGRRVLVVDDIFDSGETLREITGLLRTAGASRVYVATLVRTGGVAAVGADDPWPMRPPGR